jgi:competence protein ComEA
VPPPEPEPEAEPPPDVATPVGAEVSWAPRPTEPVEVVQGLAALLPAPLRGGRWDPGRSGAAALAVVAAVAAVLAGVVVLRSRSHEVSSPPVVSSTPTRQVGGPEVVVDVAGRVRHPGIVRLPLGSRVDDAVRAAGGPLPGASYDGLNRARKLTDGEQVLVGVPTAAGQAAGAAGQDGRVDLNLADATALDGLPGIGPVLAQKIVDWRTEHGRFASIDQLREVGGIGESKFAALKNKVRV